jgi:hypothetical protein
VREHEVTIQNQTTSIKSPRASSLGGRGGDALAFATCPCMAVYITETTHRGKAHPALPTPPWIGTSPSGLTPVAVAAPSSPPISRPRPLPPSHRVAPITKLHHSACYQFIIRCRLIALSRSQAYVLIMNVVAASTALYWSVYFHWNRTPDGVFCMCSWRHIRLGAGAGLARISYCLCGPALTASPQAAPHHLYDARTDPLHGPVHPPQRVPQPLE